MRDVSFSNPASLPAPLPASLPDDPAALRAMLVAMSGRVEHLMLSNKSLTAHTRRLTAVAERIEAEKQTYAACAQRLEGEKQALATAVRNLGVEKQSLAADATRLEVEKRKLADGVQRLETEKLLMKIQLDRLLKWFYGRKADSLSPERDLAQMLLKFAGHVEGLASNQVDGAGKAADTGGAARVGGGADAATKGSDAGRKKKGHSKGGRRDIGAMNHLPTKEQKHDLPEGEKTCACCSKRKDPIGEFITWVLERIPSHFERIKIVQLRYACKSCEQSGRNPQIAMAEKPRGPIAKGMAGPGLLAAIVTNKFSDYTPLYRIEYIMARAGIAIDRGTMSVWCREVAELLIPMYDLMVRRVLNSRTIETDDTVMPMQAEGKVAKTRMWTYRGDQLNPYNIFDFTLTRSSQGPTTFLAAYRETLVADAYSGYDAIVGANHMTRAGCMAHARRYFVDAQLVSPKIAAEAVEVFGRLYEVERRGKPLDAAARLALRRAESVPIMKELRAKIDEWKKGQLPKSPISEACEYALNQWATLTVFLEDGAVPIDNNAGEREMKRIVLGRKNSLFVGNERGGRTMAILASFTSTCKRHGIDPERYLTQVLANLPDMPDMPESDLEMWLPDEWKKRDIPPPVG